MAALPRVSVVIPVRNRRELLRRTLDALATQTFTDHEVVVVDNGSTDGAPDEALADAAAGRDVRVVDASGSAVCAARARGVAAARAPYIAFTDSDCEPAPEWLAAGVAALDDGADVAWGPTRPARPPRPLERTVAETGHSGLVPTCNVFYRASAFAAAGGFDDDAPRRFGFALGSTMVRFGWGEDTLLAWRVQRAGRGTFVPEAIVTHHVFPADPTDSLRRAWSVRGFPGLVAEVPELRDTLLERRLFLGDASRVPLYAAIAMAALGRRRLAAVAGLAWTATRVRALASAEPDRSRLAKVAPVSLAVDVTAAAALVVGSARSRNLVL